MKTYWDNHYSLTKIHKIFIALSVLLRKIWFFDTVRNGIQRTMKVCIDFIKMWHVTCHKPTNTEITLGVCFPTLLSSHKWYHWILSVPTNLVIFYLCQKSVFMVPKYIFQSVVYLSGHHVPGTMPSLLNVPYLDSTNKNESNGT